MEINWSIHKLLILKTETNSAKADHLLYKYVNRLILRKTRKPLENQQELVSR
jgi:hypothetical protein